VDLTGGDSNPGSGLTPVSDDPGSNDSDDPGSNDSDDPGSPQPASEEVFRGERSEEELLPAAPAPPAPSPVRPLFDEWWSTQQPKPQFRYIAALKVLEKAHHDGWSIDDLEAFLGDDVAAISGPALEFWRRKRRPVAQPTKAERSAASAARLGALMETTG
jgi:hypothetical protein